MEKWTAIGLCTEAVDSLHALAGANGIYDQYPIQRLFRDQHSLAAHIGFSWDAQGASWGLGEAPAWQDWLAFGLVLVAAGVQAQKGA